MRIWLLIVEEAESALPCGMSPPPVQEPPVGSNPIGDRRGGAAVYPDDGLKSAFWLYTNSTASTQSTFFQTF